MSNKQAESIVDIEFITHAWTATVQLNNDKVIVIWHTCWPSIKGIVKNVLQISSDYPRIDIRRIAYKTYL